MSHPQPSLFDLPSSLPEGLRYGGEALSDTEAAALVESFAGLPFQAFEFHGFKGARRVVSFGWRYDFTASTLAAAEPLPAFLEPSRCAAAAFAGLDARALEHAMVTEYAPGAGIGWHRDRPEFDKVVGLSFGAPATLRLRRREGDGWRRAALPLAPRSAYLLDGPARWNWQHSIAPGERLRYSVTFRSLR